jgi:multidrug resistance protein, MATE family
MNQSNLLVQNSYKQILKITLPICIAILIPQLNFFINTTFLAHLKNDKAWAIAGITGVYYLVFASIGHGLNIGLQSLISRNAGALNKSAIGSYYAHGVWVALGLAAVGIIITYTCLPQILSFFIADSSSIEMAVHFLKIRILGLPFLYFFQIRNALLVGTNNSKYLPIGTAAETFFNIFFDYCLIFGNWGFPNLGFNGAAYASVIAEIVGMMVTYFIISFKGLQKEFEIKIAFIWKKAIASNILKQSGPLMFQHALSIISWLLFFLFIGGTKNSIINLEISNTMRSVFGLFGVFSWAIGSTTNTMISNIIGQNKQDALQSVWKKLFLVSFLVSLIMASFLLIFPSLFFSFFTENQSLINTAKPVIQVVAVAMILISISIVSLSTIIGAGFSKFALFVEIFAVIFYISYSYITIKKLEVSIHIAWTNEWVYWSMILISCYWVIVKKIFTKKFVAAQ